MAFRLACGVSGFHPESKRAARKWFPSLTGAGVGRAAPPFIKARRSRTLMFLISLSKAILPVRQQKIALGEI
jgi:hypothetical protein